MYFQRPPWDTGISPPELLAYLQTHAPGRALDLGCGTGTNLLTLAQAGWQVTGMDFALQAVSQTRRRLQQGGATGKVHLGDVSRMAGITGPFELVLDIGCYHGLAPDIRADYRANLQRVLARGGDFLIYCHLVEDQSVRVGVTQADLSAFEAGLECRWRQDSQDRWGRNASWLCFSRRDDAGGLG